MKMCKEIDFEPLKTKRQNYGFALLQANNHQDDHLNEANSSQLIVWYKYKWVLLYFKFSRR